MTNKMDSAREPHASPFRTDTERPALEEEPARARHVDQEARAERETAGADLVRFLGDDGADFEILGAELDPVAEPDAQPIEHRPVDGHAPVIDVSNSAYRSGSAPKRLR